MALMDNQLELELDSLRLTVGLQLEQPGLDSGVLGAPRLDSSLLEGPEIEQLN